MKLKALVYLSLITLVISLSPAHAQTFSVIHSFSGGIEGANPSAGVTIRGNALFGTTSSGGFNLMLASSFFFHKCPAQPSVNPPCDCVDEISPLHK